MPERAQGFVLLRFTTPKKTPLWFGQGRENMDLLACTSQKKHEEWTKIGSRKVVASVHSLPTEDSSKLPVTRPLPSCVADYDSVLLPNMHGRSHNSTTRPTPSLLNCLVQKPSDLMTYD